MICCYYPTTVVAIDDDSSFLQNITSLLSSTNCISFESPNRALIFLQNPTSHQRIQSRILKTTITPEDVGTTSDDYAVLFNTRELHKEIYSDQRLHDVSVIIVDYYMDETNGMEICEKLISHPAKKILLTGGVEMDKVAINAFNKGIIHSFINKGDPHFAEQLKQSIAILQDSYFHDLSLKLLPHILDQELRSVLLNPAYINLHYNLKNKLQTIEYYLLDTIGSCLFLNASGEPSWFIVKSESEIKNYAKIALEQDADDVASDLQSISKIPFFFTENDYQHPAADWNNFLHPAQHFPGIKGYYYTVINGNVRNILDNDKIISSQFQLIDAE